MTKKKEIATLDSVRYQMTVPVVDLRDYVHAKDRYAAETEHQVLASIFSIINKMPDNNALPHLMKIYEIQVNRESVISYAPVVDRRFAFDPKNQPIEALFSAFEDVAGDELPKDKKTN
jgi:hypothetical protein